MDDEEDDVFQPDPYSWRDTFQEIKREDRGTQTPGPTLAPHSGMLPCGVAEEPRSLFYGEAGGTLRFTREQGNAGSVRVIKLNLKTVGELPCETGNSVAVLISSVAPDSRDLCSFYGLCGVCPAALLFNRRHTGIVSATTWQSTHLHQQQTVCSTEYEWQQSYTAAIKSNNSTVAQRQPADLRLVLSVTLAS